ncbi:hypothetical protein B1R27_32510 [Streptomyces sp. GKU 895]|nr:hypothetical protein B1R27_32510 [Streptomyces sp. GKU 895]
MRAMAFDKTGGPEVLHLVDLPIPTPGPDEILLRVAYAGVNYGEIQHRLGDFGEPEANGDGAGGGGVVAAVGRRAAGAVCRWGGGGWGAGLPVGGGGWGAARWGGAAGARVCRWGGRLRMCR